MAATMSSLSAKKAALSTYVRTLLGITLVAAVLLTCCHRNDSPSHPPVTFNENSGTVYIPNATIITGGSEYAETAPLGSNGLALVVTEDSSLYFYSTALGDLNALDVEHSVKALGHFLLANEGTQNQSVASVDTQLGSGVALHSVSSGRVECANTLHRWASVRVSPGGGSVLLTPRSCFKVGLIDLFEGDFGDVFQFNRIPRDTVVAGTLYETYGGVARMFLCPFTAQLLSLQGEAIEAGFSSDATAFTCLQVLDGCDVLWLVVDAISPVGAGSLAEVFGKTVFKSLVKAGVQGVLADAVAQGSAPKIVADVVARGIVDEIVNDVITGLLGGAEPVEAGDGRVRQEPLASAPRTGLTGVRPAGHDVRAAVEPVTVCLLILKAVKLAVGGTNLVWGVYDAATHDAYATYSDPAAVSPYTAALTWGEYPRDLDAHFWTPDIEGSSYHVYWQDKGQLSVAPYCELDIDDVTSYGPERVTVGSAYPGEYTYAVNQFSSDSTLPGSGAKVDLYVQGHLSRTFTVPTGPANGRTWWHVFKLNGSTGAVTVLNTLEYDPPFPCYSLSTK